MTRWFFAVLALIAGVLLWLALRSEVAPPPSPPPPVVLVPSATAPVSTAPAPQPVSPAEPGSASPTEPLTRVPVPDAGAPEAKGPFEVDLGRHAITLKDTQNQGRVANLRLKLVVDSAAGRREIVLRREELVRMLYFLGSHRDAEGATGDEGRLRFQDDLLERYRNVVRGCRVEHLSFEEYSIVPKG